MRHTLLHINLPHESSVTGIYEHPTYGPIWIMVLLYLYEA